MKMQNAGWLAAAVLVAGAVTVSGQSMAPASNDATLAALLVEVRGLRAAMEQMASAGPRVQLFASRLQLQEARINTMIRRLQDVRDSLDTAQQELIRVQGQQRELEGSLAESRASSAPGAREEAKQAEYMLDQVKQSLIPRKQKVDRLTAEEAQLTQDLTTEQGRWTEINGRLDELERMLAKK